ncbi:MAG: glycoside hydrolase family 27 protein [Odoribacteraceae bacterium]|jgi:hypothetical protein|nr:glycoside hydrolase family 27 protein [Odoribacteraceae bacterium]
MKKISTLLLIGACLAFAASGQPHFARWAPTPPMGWNSWDCYGPTVEEHEVKANADYMAAHLKKFGWEYIVVDIRWYVENDKAGGYNQQDPRYVLDANGRYTPALNRFPSAAGGKGFKPLADYVHALGLKFGIHVMRGVPREAVDRKLPVKGAGIAADRVFSPEGLCPWLRDNFTITDTPGGQAYYDSLLELYASWGVDFLKVDDIARPYHRREIEMIRAAIDKCGRPIVLSLSPGATPLDMAAHVAANANMWRVVDDLWDIWEEVARLLQTACDWLPSVAPTWPDCDMIPLGRLSIRGERGDDRPSRLTPTEQRTLMTLFTIVRSPLMFGGDLPSLDPFTRSLLTNEAILRVHREGREPRLIARDENSVIITSRRHQSQERYIALFNLADEETTLVAPLADAGITAESECRDLWTGRVTSVAGTLPVRLAPRAAALYAITPATINQ